MKRLARSIFHHWRVKLACLAAATVIWLFIKHNVEYHDVPPPGPAAPAQVTTPN